MVAMFTPARPSPTTLLIATALTLAAAAPTSASTPPEPCTAPPCLFASLSSPTSAARLTSWCPAHTSLGTKRRKQGPAAAAPDASLTAQLSAKAAKEGPGLVFDVGSFDGGDAIDFAQAGGHSVLTFEPSPSKHDAIRARLAKAGVSERVRLHPYAVSNVSGSIKFLVFNADPTAGEVFRKFALETSGGGGNGKGKGKGGGGGGAGAATGSAQDMIIDESNTQNEYTKLARASEREQRKGASHFATYLTRRKNQEAAQVVKVPVTTLDTVATVAFAERGPEAARKGIAFLKVDAQGQELRVLEGATTLFSQKKISMLQIEFCPHVMPNKESEATALLQFLMKFGEGACAPCNEPTSAVQVHAPIKLEDYVSRFRRTGPHTGKGYDNIVCDVSGGMAL